MTTLIIDGAEVDAAVEHRGDRLFVTVARPLVPAGGFVLLDGNPYRVASSRDPFEPKPLRLAPDLRAFLNEDARRRAEAAALAAAEEKIARARAQMGRYCEMELTDGAL
jgi:hypothetical protein